MAAHRVGFEIVIKTDDTVHFGTREIKAFGDLRHRFVWDVANSVFNRTQQRQQAPRQSFELLYELVNISAFIQPTYP